MKRIMYFFLCFFLFVVFLLLGLNYFVIKMYKYIGMVLRDINIILYYINKFKLFKFVVVKISINFDNDEFK